MTSCLGLELPGRWRIAAAVIVLSLVALPNIPLLLQAISSNDSLPFGDAFYWSLATNLALAALVAAVALIVGLVAGVLAALYEFPGRRLLLAMAVLPILVPSFLIAIGWSAIISHLGPTVRAAWPSWLACALAFFGSATGMTMLISYLATCGLSASQLEATRLAGGERFVFRMALRHAAPATGLTAVLAGVLSLSDPGPGMIFGFQSVAADVLTSFSAFHDFALAGRQCLALSATVLVVTLPLIGLLAPRLSDALFAKQTRRSCRVHDSRSALAAIVILGGVICIGTLLPLVGFAWPLVNGSNIQRAAAEVSRTGFNTIIYAVGAGGLAASLGGVLAIAVGRSALGRIAVVAMLLGLLALPSTVSALGFVHLGTAAPSWLDPLLRSRAAVSTVLGLRYTPIAALLMLRAWGATSSTWAQAAGLHGVTVPRYLLRVLMPQLSRAFGSGLVVVGLLATADVGAVLLIHPPGEASLTLAIFTIMANAPESLVASLCLLYVAGSALILIAVWRIGEEGTA